MKIGNLFQRTDKAQDPKKAAQAAETAKEASKAKGKASAGSTARMDSVTISEQAKNLQRADSELRTLKHEIDSADIRRDKVELAREKIANGTLLTDDAVEKTAEQIINRGALEDLVNNEHPLVRARLAETGGMDGRQEKLAQVRERIESGYYDSPEVTGKIADEIMNDILG